jgi:predicted O-methyltransferase YrrM
MRAKGLRVGPASYGVWNDGDPELVRAVWCVTRHLRPVKVVETGVARGLTTRFILEALERNGAGHLWSIDLPPPLEPELHGEIGCAVEGRFTQRWTYVRGSSRRRLPGLLAQLGQIDLFVHDSSHTSHNMRFELALAWSALRPGSVLIADDIDFRGPFHEFQETVGDQHSLVCQARPLQPDLRRFDQRGLFGISVKAAANLQSSSASA